MPTIYYPSTLPGPEEAPVTPDPRRFASDGAPSFEVRNYGRDFIGEQRLTFFFTGAEAEVFRAFWEDDLVFGARWFNSNWPFPSGLAPALVRKFKSLSWSHIGNSVARVEAVCEFRGASLEVLMADPYIDDVVLHVRLDNVNGFSDLTGRHTVTVAGTLTAGGGAGLFGRQSTVFNGAGYLRVSDNTADFQVDSGYTFEAHIAMDSPTAEAVECVAGTDNWEWFSDDSGGRNTFLNRTLGGLSFSGVNATPPNMVGAPMFHVCIGSDGVNNYAGVNGVVYTTPSAITFAGGLLCIGRNGDVPTAAGFPYWWYGRLQNIRFTQTRWRYGTGSAYPVPNGPYPTT